MYWRNGVLEKWSIGVMEYWSNGELYDKYPQLVSRKDLSSSWTNYPNFQDWYKL
ncbi:MAG: hypothetical protein JEY97_02640 [Bacteroidales bacterium]|nr:hypothetical protein [Bacteroidales bacterium]